MKHPYSEAYHAQYEDVVARMLDPEFYLSPLKAVLWGFPWGTGPLTGFDGPRNWQREEMEAIEDYLRNAIREKKETGTCPDFYRSAISSGRGPGKSAFLGMMAWWFNTTRIGSSCWVAANGEPQLRTRTFPEISKWFQIAANSMCFDVSATNISPSRWFKPWIEDKRNLGQSTKYYYTTAQLWTEENPDAFAGAHNVLGEMAEFDEASGIPDSIWGVQQGVFTEDIVDRFWFVFSNPRRPSGAFADCFDKNRALWRRRHINCLEIEGISKHAYHNIINTYGEDSNEARIEVYGTFPTQGARCFFDRDKIRDAQKRDVVEDDGAALIMGVDIGHGGDPSVARFRKGRDARSIPPVRWSGDFNKSADTVAFLMDKYAPDAVFMDQGWGSAVVDILKPRGYVVQEIAFGGSSSRPEYANKRIDMHAMARAWLDGGCIDECPKLFEEMAKIEWKYFGRADDKMILESKDDLRKRIGRSTDELDAFVLTFAHRVQRKDRNVSIRKTSIISSDFDVYNLGDY